MADPALLSDSVRRPVRAKPQALELFNRALELYSDLRQRGEIESFEPVLLEPMEGTGPASF